MMQEVVNFEGMRQKAGSRLQEGKRGTNMTEGGTRHMFVSQNDCGDDHEELSVLGTDIILVEEDDDLQVRSELGAETTFDKSTKQVINDTTQRSGGSTQGASQFMATSAFHDQPVSQMGDGIFNSEMD